MELLHFSLESFLQTAGYAGMFALVFSETGLLIGVVLPGDSVLFTAGFIASQGIAFNIWILIAIIFIAAVIGDNVGYLFGKKVGKRIFNRNDSRFFHKDNITKAQKFYDKHGPMTIVLARYIPIVRTFAPLVAGVGDMNYKIFILFDIIGCAVWAAGITLLGYYLGKTIPGVDKYLLPALAVIIVLSFLPSAIHYLKSKRTKS
jgi:membrane-associated protein